MSICQSGRRATNLARNTCQIVRRLRGGRGLHHGENAVEIVVYYHHGKADRTLILARIVDDNSGEEGWWLWWEMGSCLFMDGRRVSRHDWRWEVVTTENLG